jgi:hypothetical protein
MSAMFRASFSLAITPRTFESSMPIADILKPEAHEPVAVLDNDDLPIRIAGDSQKSFATVLQARASFLDGFHHRKAALG